ncbi:MAG: Gx transporter family protein [Lachnospiraceae bacterium]|nr:Gx transporter family protein [Lachnospiraceae bacterium]
MKKTAYMGLAVAAALILSYIEMLIPFYFGIPGMKLGLPNLLVVMILYLYGWKEALAVNVLRIVLNAFLFGNMYGLFYSLAGAFCSFFIMAFCKKIKVLSMTGVSIAGGVFHNVGQCIVAAFVVNTVQIFYYLPFLVVAGAVTGLLLGTAAKEVIKKMKRET